MKASPRLVNPCNVGADRTDVWLTPPFVIDALGGWESFDLDPCAPAQQPWPTARRTYTEAQDGLAMPWEPGERVWANPPYKTLLLDRFLRRLANHGRGVALVFSKTETQSFFDWVWGAASGLLFIKGRLHFHDADGEIAPHNAGSGSVLVAYGQDDLECLAEEPIEGQFVPLRLPRAWLVDLPRERSWREALGEFFEGRTEPVGLAEIYRAFESDAKARANPNWRPKLRQTLKRARYENVGKGLWARAVAA